MESIVRAVDVGFGNTKYVTGAAGADIRCSVFPSVAYPSARDLSAMLAAERRKTVAMPIDGLFYEVGPEVNLAADTFRATQMHDRYTETPEYLALLRGALHQMKVPAIDLLVVGLPVAAFFGKKSHAGKSHDGQARSGRRPDRDGEQGACRRPAARRTGLLCIAPQTRTDERRLGSWWLVR